MQECWSANSSDRPTFEEILVKLDPQQKQSIYIDFEELDLNYVFPPTIDDVGIIHRSRKNLNNNSSTMNVCNPSHKEDISTPM